MSPIDKWMINESSRGTAKKVFQTIFCSEFTSFGKPLKNFQADEALEISPGT
jgi:hypothetical protein